MDDLPADGVFDLAIVGAGPAGLMAALKSALLFHTAIVLDKGRRTSRAFFVPKMDNIPGYPEGVSGRKVMDDLRAQIAHAEKVAGRRFVRFEEPVEIATLERAGGVWRLGGHRVVGRNGRGETVEARARAVVLATGVVDRQPYIGENTYDITAILPYANKGLADYCLLCDGHTIRGKRVAVLGLGRGSAGIAESLRDHFGASETVLVTCIACVTGEPGHDHARHGALIRDTEALGIPVIDKTIANLEGQREDRIRLVFDDGTREDFDKAWVSFGWFKVTNDLAKQAGAAIDRDGYVTSTEDCEVLGEDGEPIPGLFVVGDLRAETWKQIPIALGDAESAVIHAYAVRL
ncbi:MAG TPA: NAD(P)/FAD-dependent oxidoreductase [Candidatus Thermoplasmatota archaeon]|nr:NAD(P)/FAD-dependent oxidoreductase [Candidatus Thermoplasmatota archaeon]